MSENNKRICVSVVLTEEEVKMLEERMEYLKEKKGYTRLSKSEAIRHAIRQTNYKRTKGNDE